MTLNSGHLEVGDFDQQVWGLRTMVNFSSDLQLSSFIQYDDDSRQIGTNTRLRWTFSPLGEMFLVYGHNVLDRPDDLAGTPLEDRQRWTLDAARLLLKVQYALRW